METSHWYITKIYLLSPPGDTPGGKNKISMLRGRTTSHPLIKMRPYCYLGPAVACIVFVFGYPIVRLAHMSFVKIKGTEEVFVGFFNYQYMFSDNVFWLAIRNNIILFLSVPVLIFLSLVFSVLIYERLHGWRFYQALVLLPYILAIPIVGITFSYILQYRGVINQTLKVLHLGGLVQDWLGDYRLTIFSIMGVIIWREAGFGVILFLARLMSLPEQLFEAAELDGAGWWQTLWYITIPQMKSIIHFYTVFCLITMMSWVFNYVYTISLGGPANYTMVSELYIYLKAFRHSLMGVAAAVSVFLFAMVSFLVFLRFRAMKGILT